MLFCLVNRDAFSLKKKTKTISLKCHGNITKLLRKGVNCLQLMLVFFRR